MRIAFLSEMGFSGKVVPHYPNMRTEFAWMYALDADHYNLTKLDQLVNYDHVFIIFPKGEVYLNAVGSKLIDKKNPVSDLLAINIVAELKKKNKYVHYIQEGPHWLWNEYEIFDQINFYNLLMQCDSIFAHNEYDTKYYSGLLPNKIVNIIPSLMIESSISSMIPDKKDAVIIGGNFARWYGGFESYVIASQFELPIYTQNSHAKRDYEENIENLNHLPRLSWENWMNTLKDFKYAVHLMPTIAAGTFSLNCAYFGIPCIGNEKVDTQRTCHPDLSVDVADLHTAKKLVHKLKTEPDFYNQCSKSAKENYFAHYNIEVWKSKMNEALCL